MIHGPGPVQEDEELMALEEELRQLAAEEEEEDEEAAAQEWVRVRIPPEAQQPSQDACDHPGIPEPKFDEEAAKGMSVYEVREWWPRVTMHCQRCGAHITRYASRAHYYAGDW